MARQRLLGIVLAGAEGKGLAPLTADRAKSAVSFGGLYRVVDFALSNLVNGGLQRIAVLTQYKSHSLNRHITTTWRLSNLLDNYVTPVPAQQRLGPRWQTGSADAIYQSLNLIHADRNLRSASTCLRLRATEKSLAGRSAWRRMSCCCSAFTSTICLKKLSSGILICANTAAFHTLDLAWASSAPSRGSAAWSMCARRFRFRACCIGCIRSSVLSSQ